MNACALRSCLIHPDALLLVFTWRCSLVLRTAWRYIGLFARVSIAEHLMAMVGSYPDAQTQVAPTYTVALDYTVYSSRKEMINHHTLVSPRYGWVSLSQCFFLSEFFLTTVLLACLLKLYLIFFLYIPINQNFQPRKMRCRN